MSWVSSSQIVYCILSNDNGNEDSLEEIEYQCCNSGLSLPICGDSVALAAPWLNLRNTWKICNLESWMMRHGSAIHCQAHYNCFWVFPGQWFEFQAQLSSLIQSRIMVFDLYKAILNKLQFIVDISFQHRYISEQQISHWSPCPPVGSILWIFHLLFPGMFHSTWMLLNQWKQCIQIVIY